MLFAYSIKSALVEHCSEKIAIMEGVLGFGCMSGSITSSYIKKFKFILNIY